MLSEGKVRERRLHFCGAFRRAVFARAATGLAPSQNVFEKLFVSNTPNKGINVMLMTLWPITAPLMDPSALENLFSLLRRTSERLFELAAFVR